MLIETLETLARNSLKEKLVRGDVVASMIVRLMRSHEIGRIAAAAGFDTLYVDLEHSVLSIETTAQICHAAREAGVVPLVRIPQIDAALVCRLLDGGAMGIVFPHVESAADARRATQCALYPPEGNRSTSSGQALLNYRSFPQAAANAALNKGTFVALMIESKTALAQIEEIAAVPGIDMLFVGAGDLSADLGLAGQTTHAWVADAISRVLRAGKRHGVAVGLGGLAGQYDYLADWVAKGVKFISTGTDLAFIARAAKDAVDQVRALTTKTQ